MIFSTIGKHLQPDPPENIGEWPPFLAAGWLTPWSITYRGYILTYFLFGSTLVVITHGNLPCLTDSKSLKGPRVHAHRLEMVFWEIHMKNHPCSPAWHMMVMVSNLDLPFMSGISSHSTGCTVKHSEWQWSYTPLAVGIQLLHFSDYLITWVVAPSPQRQRSWLYSGLQKRWFVAIIRIEPLINHWCSHSPWINDWQWLVIVRIRSSTPNGWQVGNG